MRVLIHGFGRGQRRLLAIVDEGGFAVVRAQQQKSAAAEIACCRMHDGERKSGGNGRIDGIAALAQHLNPGVGSQVVHADHHSVARAHGLFILVGKCLR